MTPPVIGLAGPLPGDLQDLLVRALAATFADADETVLVVDARGTLTESNETTELEDDVWLVASDADLAATVGGADASVVLVSTDWRQPALSSLTGLPGSGLLVAVTPEPDIRARLAPAEGLASWDGLLGYAIVDAGGLSGAESRAGSESLPTAWRTAVVGRPGEAGLTARGDAHCLGTVRVPPALEDAARAARKSIVRLRPGDGLTAGQQRLVRRARLALSALARELRARLGPSAAQRAGVETPRSGQDLPWRRFWVPAGSRPTLSDGGFLLDPGGPYGRYVDHPHLSLGARPSAPCLVLLGEPGMGKSKVLGRLRERCPSPAVLVDLERDVARPEHLRRALFGPAPLRAAHAASEPYVIFVDSLDVGRIDPADVLLELRLGIQDAGLVPGQDVVLRIACRTSAWLSSLRDELAMLWAGDVEELVLAPLTREDVALAATRELGERADRFVEEVRRRDLAPLAAHPLLLLRFLLPRFAAADRLFGGRAELYEQGCRRLAEEWSDRRRDRDRRSATLSAAERLDLAGRLAWYSALTWRHSIWTGRPSEADGELCLPRDEVAAALGCGVAGLEEALATALFAGPETDSRRWFTHWSLGEYLAARHAVGTPGLLARTLDLLRVSVARVRRIPPQLLGVASWLASLDRRAQDALIADEPRALLESGVDLPSEGREALVERLIVRHRQGIEPVGAADSRLADRLLHPRLAGQLGPVLDGQEDPELRRFAARVAGASGDPGLALRLVELALSHEVPPRVRVAAAASLPRDLADEPRARLRPLVLPGDPADEDDQLRGAALRLLWPGVLSAGELFRALTPPRHRLFVGLYELFLADVDSVLDALTPEDLPGALRWAAGVRGGPYDDRRATLAVALQERAWDFTHVSEVAEALGRVFAVRLVDHALGDGPARWREDEGRRRLALHVVGALTAVQVRVHGLQMVFDLGLFEAGDAAWIRETRDQAEGEERAKWDLLLELLDPPAPDPARAARWAEERAEWQRRKEAHDREFVRRWPPFSPERLSLLLDHLDDGRLELWTLVDLELWKKETPGAPVPSRGSLLDSPGWVTLDPPTRGRVVDAAGDYLAGATVETEGWFGKHTHPGWVVAAWHAWDLVLAKDPDEVEALPAERWADWTPLLLDTMLGKGPRHLHCLGLAWERARTAWLDAYDRLAEAADHAADWIRLRSHAEACWDDALAAHLLELLDREILPGEGRRALLGLLLERDVDAARAWAGGHLSEEGVAATLLRQAHDAGWPELARHMETDPDLFARALEEAVDRGDYEHAPGRLLERLPSPGAAGDLAAWLMERYPPEGDPDFDGVHVVGSREEMGWFRGRVIDWLKASGHAEELDRLAERFSERRWLREIARDAAITAAGAAWSPPTLRELARLEQRAEARFVHDGAHLLELTLAAIDRIQAEALSGELAVARNLYDETPDGGRRPMDEPTLSDWLAYELKRRLEAVVVNREVQIGAHHGRTDIRLDALGPDSPPLTVQIEVKGAWHRDVRSALRTQLVDDYLSHYPRGHGLYVVFWFDLDDWDAGDRRRRAARRHFPTADEAQTALDRQAEEASAATPHRVRAKVLRVTRRPAAE